MSGRNVLISSAGRRAELVRSFRAAADGFRDPPSVHAIDVEPELSSACALADARAPSPRADDPRFGPFLLDYCRRERIGLVVPTNDHELLALARLRDDFAGRGIHLLVPGADLVERCADKRRAESLFTDLDIPYPKVYSPDGGEYPRFVKPARGSAGIGARRIASFDELSPRERLNPELIHMELVDPSLHEYTADCYFDRDGALRCAVPRRRLAVRAGEVSKAITVRGPVSEFISRRIATLRGAVGCVTLQVFSDVQAVNVWGVEINPRFGGGYPLAFAAGANYPRALMKEYLFDEDADLLDDWEDATIMLRYDAHIIRRPAPAGAPPEDAPPEARERPGSGRAP